MLPKAYSAAKTSKPPIGDHSVFDLPSFCAWAHIGRTRAFEEIRSGRLKARRIGKKSLITIEDAREWFASLPSNVNEAA
jgi:hypothetical protein